MCRGVEVCALFRSGPSRRIGWFWRSLRSLPPPALFLPLPVICVRFFLPLAFQGWPGSGRVCVCNICIDVKPFLFLFSLLLVFIVISFNCFVQGAVAHA